MRFRTAYIGWRGTSVRDYTDTGFLEYVVHSLEHRKWFRSFRAESENEKGIREIKEKYNGQSDMMVEEIYDFCNHPNMKLLCGLKLAKLREITTNYVKENLKGKLEKDLLEPLIKSKKKQGGLDRVVIGPTPAYEGEIRETLTQNGYSPDLFGFLCNPLDKKADRNSVKRFRLDINDPESRQRYLKVDVGLRGKLKPSEIIYIGSTGKDINCLAYISDNGGLAIISPLASEEFRDKMKKALGEHKASFPGTMTDFAKLLE